METKRCPGCHRLQRATTKTCSHCQYVFVKKKPRIPQTLEQTNQFIPPASPHRAGHYSGLHPEDQPYQSSKIAVQSLAKPETEPRRLVQHEPEQMSLPAPQTAAILEWHNKATLPCVDSIEISREERGAFLRKVFPSGRAISVITAASCIIFLLASSIVAFALINKEPATASSAHSQARVTARISPTQPTLLTLEGSGFGPADLIVFTYDQHKRLNSPAGQILQTHANGQGTFSVQALLPAEHRTGSFSVEITDMGATTFTLTVQVTGATTFQDPLTPLG
ncbi:hypothetical protein EPA93_27320 [Ktedonosporobacter rubrisoli]|uniref:Uncharacterized protein n=1 Tax=Ktedonosporobacter rubrisoli TaxID=2509675 RepID=A0A4P6JV08_KTERU|nr:hypothetical protein [Ktedonosporobacter rubrisoli]QBD79489.1 hypothetical protein EPA93_27320 [Ktedonosporobacter rubrisoli]